MEPQTMAKIIQPFAAPCTMRIPQGGSGSTDDGSDVRSHEVGGGMAPGAPAGGGGCGGEPGTGGGVGCCIGGGGGTGGGVTDVSPATAPIAGGGEAGGGATKSPN